MQLRQSIEQARQEKRVEAEIEAVRLHEVNDCSCLDYTPVRHCLFVVLFVYNVISSFEPAEYVREQGIIEGKL